MFRLSWDTLLAVNQKENPAWAPMGAVSIKMAGSQADGTQDLEDSKSEPKPFVFWEGETGAQ